jgi:two-component system chemotaxis response regulator CheB
MKALDRGAADVMAKPKDELTGKEETFGPELRRRLKALVGTLNKSSGKGARVNELDRRGSTPDGSVDIEPIRALLIGGSTGAPPVVREILSCLPQDCPIPLIVVQHIEEPFLSSFQENIGDESDLKVEEIQNRTEPTSGTVYFAPEGHHLEIKQWGDEYQLKVREGSPVHNALPSVEVLFQSAAQAYGAQCMAYLLTGLGEDGAEGMKALNDRGAYCVVQDRESSVVHGMAGSALEKGAVDRQVSAEELPEFTRNFIRDHSAATPLIP